MMMMIMIYFLYCFLLFVFAFVIEIVFVFVFSSGIIDKKRCVEHVRRFERRREQARRFVAVSPTGWQSGNNKKKKIITPLMYFRVQVAAV